MASKTIILSLGGSLIIPHEIDVAFLKKIKTLLLLFVKEGFRFIIVTGGGQVCRIYNRAAEKIFPNVAPADLDWIGIATTKLNAELVRSIFGAHTYPEILTNPTKRIITEKKILIGCGWKPGSSSDKDAILLAQAYDASTVINLSNIPYVYSADPKKNRNAQPITEMGWDELLKLTGRRWKPGAHVPFDPEASKLAKQLGIRVVICLGTDIPNLRKILTGKKFQGTVIS